MTVPVFTGTLPDPADRVTYGSRGRAMWEYETQTLVPAINQTAGLISEDRFAAEEAAGVAAAMRDDKGPWNLLTGALARPASVTHNDKLWILTVDVAASPGVQTFEPGVSLIWSLYEPQGTADDLTFNNAGTSVVAETVQGALVELDTELQDLTTAVAANLVTAASDATTKANAAKIQDGTPVGIAGLNSHTFTGIPTTAKRIVITFSGVSTTTSGHFFGTQIGSSSGIQTTGYAGWSSRFNASGQGGNTSTAGFHCVTQTNSEVVSGSMVLTRHSVVSSAPTWVQTNGVGGSNILITGAGSTTLPSALTQIRVLILNSGTGTFAAGTICLHWEV